MRNLFTDRGVIMLDNKLIEYYKSYLKENLSEKRYTHSINVANEAVELAKLYSADEDVCYIAGLLHDVCKEMPCEKQYELAKKWHNVSEVELKSLPLLHSVAGAVFVRDFFRIDDERILSSIRSHTAAMPDMTIIDKIIYISDLTSADRNYPDVLRFRKMSRENLDFTMLEALRFNITDCVKKENTIPVGVINAYNQLLLNIKEMK